MSAQYGLLYAASFLAFVLAPICFVMYVRTKR